jgi:hypothetical protein
MAKDNKGQGRGFFTENEEDRKKHQEAGSQSSGNEGNRGQHQEAGRLGGQARAAQSRGTEEGIDSQSGGSQQGQDQNSGQQGGESQDEEGGQGGSR